MAFFANRADLDTRTLLTRIHNQLQTRVPNEDSPIEQVWYQTSAGNKVGVRAIVTPETFLRTSYPIDEAELQVSFDFPHTHTYDFYTIQWVEPDRNLMLGWHQDEAHINLGECHFQIDDQDTTVQRERAAFLDTHPLNVFDQRINELVGVLSVLTWEDSVPHLPTDAVR